MAVRAEDPVSHRIQPGHDVGELSEWMVGILPARGALILLCPGPSRVFISVPSGPPATGFAFEAEGQVLSIGPLRRPMPPEVPCP